MPELLDLSLHFRRFISHVLLVNAVATGVAHGQGQPPAKLSKGTPEHWLDAGWWPTKGTSKHADYAGTAACAMCHKQIVDSQQTTPMHNAACLPRESQILNKHPELPFADDKYTYLLSHKSGDVIQWVKETTETASLPVGWAFGAGEVSQTYVFERDHKYLESRLSYYTGLSGLGITPGHSAEAPPSAEEAVGDVVDDETMRRCFGCHSTASTVDGVFDPKHATLGVTCEACHGPGLKHVTTMRATRGKQDSSYILNPKEMSPVDSVDFCGACHRTPFDVGVYMQHDLGVASVRFQPYRLERSLCWGVEGDARITCIACHDPHKPLVRGASAYDSTCLRCHAASPSALSQSAAPPCKVAKKDCTSCHMAKVEVPAVHATFTDHFIRVVRPGSVFRQ